MIEPRQTDRRYEHTEGLEFLQEAINYNSFLRQLIQHWAPPGADRAVDFGAGIGTFSDALQGRVGRTTCVEIDPFHREVLTSKGFEIAALEDIAQDSIDYAYSLNVIEHIDDDVGILRKIARTLKPHGRILIYVPALNALWSSMDDLVGHVRRYDRPTLITALRSAGLKPLEARYADSAGLVATLCYKLVGRSDGKIDSRTIRLFDRFAFPLGRLLDHAGMQHLAGKNVYAVAEKIERAPC